MKVGGRKVNMRGAEVVRVDEFKYPGSTIKVSAGRVERVEMRVRGDLRQKGKV